MVTTSLPPDILCTAAKAHNQAEMFKLLIDKGANIHARMSNGDSVLHVIMKHSPNNSSLEIAKMLIKAGCDPLMCNSSGKTPLHIAASRGHLSIVEDMLPIATSLPSDILFTGVGAINNQVEMVQMLIDKGADIHACTYDGDNVLHVVMGHSHNSFSLEIVKVLIEAGCNLLMCNSSGETPLHTAVSEGHISIMEDIFPMATPLPPDILFAGARAPNQAEVLKLLIDKGADIHACMSNGDSVLHAIMEHSPNNSSLEIVKMLIKAGCDPLICNSSGKTPLHIAVSRGYTSIWEP
ncbi:hypothetical protein PAXINDRAFT_20419 [Paxillus involutus ATCC 200175]|uniref:Unplaced genomic scaffold PAXINscaffold_1029, whole genome shotgun sequence n=1 Tax=Paxillus involutus ATCC 200175 TaxID=664439 RepID=A0A0C9SV05_PAXIN|nr:hypothetical protein PAXINDRAFT_20419 [Paxillus involutus ATCC 200175]